jgi:glycerophosphoryl diester phosphodiesterase
MPNFPVLLGHRGARSTRSVPENTFASFDLALEHGCDGFEFDLRLTGSGRAVVCHDPKVDGITVSRADQEQLVNLPYLEDVLQQYGRRAFLDIELKVPGLEPRVLGALRDSPPNEYVVSSFIPDVIMELKARSAGIQLGIICDKRAQLTRWNKLPIDYVIAHQSLVTGKLVDDVHSAGRNVFAWTVNDEKTMLRLADWQIDGIISDNTKLLAETFKHHGTRTSH